MRVADMGRKLARFLADPREGHGRGPSSRPELLAATLRRGDVLLVEGTSRFSAAIKYLTQSTWSHAALCLGPQAPGGEPLFVDVDVLEGVRTVPLAGFGGLHARICRPVGLAPAEVDAVAGFMLDRLGHRYDTRNIVDLARFLLWQPPVPDPMKRRMLALGSGEPTRAICSTLLAQAFGSIRYPILPEIELLDTTTEAGRMSREEILHIRHHSLYTPRDFDVSPFFQVVKPRLEAGFDFRRLVWSADEGGTNQDGANEDGPRGARPSSPGDRS